MFRLCWKIMFKKCSKITYFPDIKLQMFIFAWAIVYHYASTHPQAKICIHWLTEEILVYDFGKLDFSVPVQIVMYDKSYDIRQSVKSQFLVGVFTVVKKSTLVVTLFFEDHNELCSYSLFFLWHFILKHAGTVHNNHGQILTNIRRNLLRNFSALWDKKWMKKIVIPPLCMK